MKVLVADDSRIIRCMLNELLQNWGFEVIVTQDGHDAWEVLTQPDCPPITILDWEMPGCDGLELCRRISRKEFVGQPYTIVLTSKTGASDRATILEAGADDFIAKPFDSAELKARISVAKRTAGLKSNLKQTLTTLQIVLDENEKAKGEVEKILSKTQSLVSSLPSILIELDITGQVCRWNKAAELSFGIEAQSACGRHFQQIPVKWAWENIDDAIETCCKTLLPIKLENYPYIQPTGRRGILDLTVSPMLFSGTLLGTFVLASDITERKTLESHLAMAQKLESIGQLAAGIAHEINTPMQFVSDNLRFIQDSFGAIDGVLAFCRTLVESAQGGSMASEAFQKLEGTLQEADVDYLLQEIPKALSQSLDGTARVSKIVRAMKDFSHPGTEEKKPIDLNQAIESTVTVARNEWKYVADLEMTLDPELPLVPCRPGEFNQVMLNLIVNAAHAIGGKVGPGNDQKGTITVSTKRIEGRVEVRVLDTGTGIPEEVQGKIFDPFFTTKEVGKGTGQGLAIAHDVIVKKHGGELKFETEIGQGTTFIIRLPLDATG